MSYINDSIPKIIPKRKVNGKKITVEESPPIVYNRKYPETTALQAM